MTFFYAHHLHQPADLAAYSDGKVTMDLSQVQAMSDAGLSRWRSTLIAVRTCCDLRDSDAASALTPALPRLGSSNAALHLELSSSDQYDKPSSPRAMPAAAALVTQLAKRAAEHRVALALSPRTGHWMQRIEDAVRVAMRVNRADVGVVFNFGHWHAVDGDASLLDQRIKLALPKLMAVTVPVRRPVNEKDWQAVSLQGEPIDFQTLKRLLVAGGYRGPVILEAI